MVEQYFVCNFAVVGCERVCWPSAVSVFRVQQKVDEPYCFYAHS